MVRLRVVGFPDPCICEHNPTGRQIIRCRCGKINNEEPSEEEEPTSSPPAKKRAIENREEAVSANNQVPEASATKNNVANRESLSLKNQVKKEDVGSDGRMAESSGTSNNTTNQSSSLLNNAEENNERELMLIDKIQNILDDGSFVELMKSKDSIVVGEGKINNRRVVVYAHHLLAPGNPILQRQCKKIVYIRRHAMSIGVPLLGIEDFCGVVNEHEKYADFIPVSFEAFGEAKHVPYVRIQINAENVNIKTTYDMIVADFLFSVGPSNEDILRWTQGVFESPVQAKTQIHKLFNYLPRSNLVGPRMATKPWTRKHFSLDQSFIPFDVRCVLDNLIDDCEFFEIKKSHALGIVTGFCQLQGKSFAIIANNQNCDRTIREEETIKGVDFLDICQRFRMPLIAIFDIPTLINDYSLDNQYLKRLSSMYKTLCGLTISVITRSGLTEADDSTVSDLFISMRTYIWKTEAPLAAKKYGTKTIMPKETRQKICYYAAKKEKHRTVYRTEWLRVKFNTS